ncbi:hypothetical protein [Paenibacillus sp. MMS20-IR301]|uniref:hypothetical protein n=1 Tax=Paenibacillus sp. MMS20-IR301 TaxID=2895946 RepID=UPI0028ED42E5|nr:hypothetical protein [Paenibacillus sp. MMS20-IR301]WNS44692.1 hypothetical protein LOS79_05300 [Paenibacillus sp. MMS20-IR301]
MIIVILLYRLMMFRRRFTLAIRPEDLQVKNATIAAERIKRIYVKGYFKPVIAVKPRGRLMVPYKYCFSFADQEDQAIKELKAWAGQHQIEVRGSGFARWL